MESPDNSPIYKIAAEISNADAKLLSEISECLLHTSDYFRKHLENYENRGMEEERDIDKIRWIGMVDSLIEHGYVCECDYKEELDEVLSCIKVLKGVRNENLPLEPDWFDEEDEITDWCETIDQNWQPQDMCIAAIDIGSDSYVMFACRRDSFKTLCEYAEEAGYRIDLACNM